MNSLYKSFKSSPRYSMKWSNYFEIYNRVLKKFINKKVTLVEVGVADGGSLFMWKKFLGNKANIIGVELNPEAKTLEKKGFKIFIGDQADPLFWKNFYKKVGKIDILIDDGGHTNLQQITTLMESINYIKRNGVIIVEDTHASFISYKGFKNPSKFSFINFSVNFIENIHRRNPMLNKKIGELSNKIMSIEYFDSIVVFNFSKKKLNKTKNLKNNKSLEVFYDDYRYKKFLQNKKKKNFISEFFRSKISKRSWIYRFYENYVINLYLKKIKK